MRLGKYTILRKLATGGMAEIFLARSDGVEGFQKDVVIKRILPIHDDNEELIDMFLDEARITSTLNHPNVVQVYELGKERGHYFIVMEYVHGEDLRRVCERGLKRDDFLPLPYACKIVSDAALGLHYAHTQTDPHGVPLHIVHRDVSPQNILVGFDGAAKMTDFGIAKAENKASTTRTGQLKGKFSYMSPEQCLGHAVDHRSDIFSLGTVLYETTLCTRLFKADNELKAIGLIAKAKIAPPRKLRPDFPAELDRIIMKALARDKDERYPHAQEMHLDLEAFLSTLSNAPSRVDIGGYMRALFPERLVPEPTTAQPYVDEDAPTRNFDRVGLLSAMAHMHSARSEDPVTEPDNLAIDIPSDTQPTVSAPASHASASPSHSVPQGASMPQPNLISSSPPTTPAGALLAAAQPLPATGIPVGRPSAPRMLPVEALRMQLTGDPPETLQAAPTDGGFGGGGGSALGPGDGGGGDGDDWDDDEDFEAELAMRRKKNRNTIIGVVVGILLLGLIGFLVLDVETFETAKEGHDDGPEILGGQEEWEELPMVDVQVASEPAGAHVVINGTLQEGPTPGSYKLIQGKPNTILLFKEGYKPLQRYVPGGEALDKGFTEALEVIPAPPAPEEEGAEKKEKSAKDTPPTPPAPVVKKGIIWVRPKDPDAHAGSELWFDGKQIPGGLPAEGVKIQDVLQGSPHHVLARKEGFADVAVVVLSIRDEMQVEVSLCNLEDNPLCGTHKTQLSFDVTPTMANLMVNEQKEGLKKSSSEKKGQLFDIDISADEYVGFKHTIHTTPAGEFTVQVDLPAIPKGKFQVALVVPEGQYWYGCLKDATQSGKCWNSVDVYNQPQVMSSGTYSLDVWEQEGDHSKDRMKLEKDKQPSITFEPNMSYTINIEAFNDTDGNGKADEILYTLSEPTPWDPNAPPEAPKE